MSAFGMVRFERAKKSRSTADERDAERAAATPSLGADGTRR
jgi:hypothetical protein